MFYGNKKQIKKLAHQEGKHITKEALAELDHQMALVVEIRAGRRIRSAALRSICCASKPWLRSMAMLGSY